MKLSDLNDIDSILEESLSSGGLILKSINLDESFFDLKTGLAGGLFQKFVNYNQKLALLLDDPEIYGERFTELVLEHRHHPNVRFFDCKEDAQNWIHKEELL